MKEKVIIKGEKYNIWGSIFPLLSATLILVGLIIIWCIEGHFWIGWLFETFYGLIFLGLVFVAFLICFGMSKCDLIITNKRAYGKAMFGKRVDLPMDSISAVGARWPKGIAVATSSGKISFFAIKNRDDLHGAINNLLIERQQKSPKAEASVIKQEVQQSGADELKKYKELLDSGIITQEEFDAKKKQLLGL